MKDAILEQRETKLSDGRILTSEKYYTDTMTLHGISQKEVMWHHSIGVYGQNIYSLKKKGLLSEEQYQMLSKLK